MSWNSYIVACLMATIAFSSYAQCTKDTDCKGKRICETGVCVAPPSEPQATPIKPQAPRPAGPYPKFQDYPVVRHPGPWFIPKGVRRVSENEWRNDQGKLIDRPTLNFGAKYAASLHSCGTGCRYYTLTDLSTGRDFDTLAPFSSGEPSPMTKDGYLYVTDLVTRAGSNMLVAQYQVENGTVGGECRERIFVLENERLRPITETKYGCSAFPP